MILQTSNGSDRRLDYAKQSVLQYLRQLDAAAGGDQTIDVCAANLASSHRYRGVHPFNSFEGVVTLADTVWTPLKAATGPIQRRLDIFLAGYNELDQRQSIWIVAMGHLLGLFDRSWLGITPTRKVVDLPFVSFFRIENEQIVETVEFFDILAVADQAGENPFAEFQTAAQFLAPGPRTHDGCLFRPQDRSASRKTLDLTQTMLNELVIEMRSPPEHLARYWHSDMNWFGPTGIGSCVGFGSYRRGHTRPFEERLEFLEGLPWGCSVAEGHYAGFFWRPCLKMRSLGGFLGLPESDKVAEMRVVDIYRRQGDKLAENWIFIDFLHVVHQFGVDVIESFGAKR